ncbi:MAG: MFS transporter [Caldilineaceae bacterium]|nr:MFS transporter [Caldilineaceae bacterium]
MAASTSPTLPSPPLRTSRMIRRTPFFYGWIILMAGMLGIVMMGPSQTFTISLFIDHFVQDLGISRSIVSLLYGVATLTASFLLPITGRLVDRYGTRRLIVVNALAFGLAIMLLSQLSGPWSLLGMMLVVRFLGFGSMQLISNNVIAQWFVRRRGLVMGLAGQSLTISLLIYPALSNWLIGELGWRMAWVTLGALALAVMLPAGWLFFRDRPELYGLLPDGRAPTPAEVAAAGKEEHWTLAEARRTPIFWLFAVACTVLSIITAGLVFHQTSLFEVHGVDGSLTVLCFQLQALFAIVGNLGIGYLFDHVPTRRLLALQMILLGAAIVQMQLLQSMLDVVIYSALMGLTTGSFRVMDATVWARYFGRLHLGSIRGATMIGTVGGTALGTFMLGLAYDLTGGYGYALNLLLTLPLLIAIASFIVKRPPTRVSTPDPNQPDLNQEVHP